jgi:hypothetical protein
LEWYSLEWYRQTGRYRAECRAEWHLRVDVQIAVLLDIQSS